MACLAQVDTYVTENAGQPCSTIENLYIYISIYNYSIIIDIKIKLSMQNQL